jgi:hypothetical protein
MSTMRAPSLPSRNIIGLVVVVADTVVAPCAGVAVTVAEPCTGVAVVASWALVAKVAKAAAVAQSADLIRVLFIVLTFP